MNKVVLCLFISLIFGELFGQQNINEKRPDVLYQKGVVLYNEGALKSASKFFEQYNSQLGAKTFTIETEYYLSVIDFLNSDRKNIALLEQFVNKNRNHSLASVANFHLGNHAFTSKNYAKALQYYTYVSEDQLGKLSLLEFLFKRGYANMIKGNNKLALNDFKQIGFFKKAYYSASAYYSGFIYTEEQNFSEALSVLLEADDKKGDYKGLITELIANIYYQTEAHDKLIGYAEENLTESPTSTNRSLHRLLGETYFNKKDYQLAAKHFQRHLDFSKNRMDADGYYKLGFSYYKIKNREKAINNFKISALEKGDLTQSSSFFLGKLYLESKNYQYSLSAFQNAINQGGNKLVLEEASFLVGKIDFSTGQYASAISRLSDFKSEYPNSKWSTESSELLTKSYLKTSDYKQAIDHIEGLSFKTSVIKEAYQSVCFLNAQQLFNDSKFKESIEYLEKSLLYPIKKEITAEAYYLLGESYSLINKTSASESAFLNCIQYGKGTKWANFSLYGLGYIFYNDKKFEVAENHFQKFIDSAGKQNEFYADAKMRLADCQYVQKKYTNAITTYHDISNSNLVPQDYINYQLGINYALNGQDEIARLSFSKVLAFPKKSSYKDNAQFQMAESYTNISSFDKAAEMHTQLITNYPESSLIPYSLSKRASCYFNLNQDQLAKDDYEYILNNHIKSAVANSALLGLQELIKRGVEVPEFDNYMDLFREANPDDLSLEVVTFETAKNKYYNQNYISAISAFKDFESKYPESSFQIDVQYFKADSYYRLADWKNAASAFKELITPNANAYKNRSLDKRGKSLQALTDFKSAIKNYRLLLTTAGNRKEQFIALDGLMNSYFKLDKMDSSIYFANAILDGDWVPVGMEESAWLIKGKSLIKKENYSQATDELIKVLNGPIDEKSAEAKYNLGLIFFKQNLYKESLESLFELNKSYGSYGYWIGKSFLLISDNYVSLGELLQAKATLQSIIDNSPENEIVSIAKLKLLKVEVAEKEFLVQDTIKVDSTVNQKGGE